MITANKVFELNGESPTGNLIYIGIPAVNYGTGIINVVDNLINGGYGPNTTGLSFQLGGGEHLKVLASSNNVQSVAVAQAVGPGVTLVGPTLPSASLQP